MSHQVSSVIYGYHRYTDEFTESGSSDWVSNGQRIRPIIVMLVASGGFIPKGAPILADYNFNLK